mmetsp:Transcript_2526/g.10012  ORF Transcript_2526/g.10012 Transcript_2526/m.10012 type:complete len:260 (-) Transcript_2526:2487-3266(-)
MRAPPAGPAVPTHRAVRASGRGHRDVCRGHVPRDVLRRLVIGLRRLLCRRRHSLQVHEGARVLGPADPAAHAHAVQRRARVTPPGLGRPAFHQRQAAPSPAPRGPQLGPVPARPASTRRADAGPPLVLRPQPAHHDCPVLLVPDLAARRVGTAAAPFVVVVPRLRVRPRHHAVPSCDCRHGANRYELKDRAHSRPGRVHHDHLTRLEASGEQRAVQREGDPADPRLCRPRLAGVVALALGLPRLGCHVLNCGGCQLAGA